MLFLLVFYESSTSDIVKCSFCSCTAPVGGAIFFNGENLSVSQSVFFNCTASSVINYQSMGNLFSGGAILSIAESSRLSDVCCCDCHAKGYGSAICILGEKHYTSSVNFSVFVSFVGAQKVNIFQQLIHTMDNINYSLIDGNPYLTGYTAKRIMCRYIQAGECVAGCIMIISVNKDENSEIRYANVINNTIKNGVYESAWNRLKVFYSHIIKSGSIAHFKGENDGGMLFYNCSSDTTISSFTHLSSTNINMSISINKQVCRGASGEFTKTGSRTKVRTLEMVYLLICLITK